MAVYDQLELKAMTKKLKARMSELLAEQSSLQQQISELASTYASAKQNVNSLGVDDEIRMFEGDDTVVLDKKFLEADQKLEVQILNQEIKACLPKLEHDAVFWEQQMHGIEKQTQKAAAGVAKLPSHLTKTTEELEQLFHSLTERKQELTASIKSENDRKMQRLKNTKIDVNKLRTQITAVVEQQTLVQQSTNRLRGAVLSEETRLQILRKEYDTLEAAYGQMMRNAAETDGPDAQAEVKDRNQDLSRSASRSAYLEDKHGELERGAKMGQDDEFMVLSD